MVEIFKGSILIVFICMIVAIVVVVRNCIVRSEIESCMFRLTFGGVNNDEVNRYIHCLRDLRIRNTPEEWAGFRACFNMINDDENIDSSLKEYLSYVLVNKGIILGNMKVNLNGVEKEEMDEREKEIIEKKAKENVTDKLKWLGEEWKSLHDVIIPHRIEEQKVDSIIVGPKGVFHIETINYGGASGGIVFINRDGDWTKGDRDKLEGVESPSFKVDIHNRVLRDYLKFKFPDRVIPVVGIIVLGNEKTLINGIENSKAPVIKAERLIDFIENYDSSEVLTKNDIRELYCSLKFYE